MDLNIEEEIEKIDNLKFSDSFEAEQIINHLLTLPLTELQRIKLQVNLAYCLWGNANPARSKELYSEVLPKAKRLELPEIIADVLSGLGVLESDEGNFDLATEKYKQAISLYQRLNNAKKEAHTTNRLAINDFMKGDLVQAKQLLERTSLLTKNTDQMMYIQARNNIALIHLEEGKIYEAAQEFKKCSANAKSIGFYYGISVMSMNYAETLIMLGEYQQAQEVYEQAILYTQELKDSRNYAIISASYANLHILKGNLKKAKILLQQAIELFQPYEDKMEYVNILEFYAKYWVSKGNFKQAIIQLENAYTIINETGLITEKISVLSSIAEIYQSLKNYKKAYHYIKEIDSIAWEVNSEEGKILSLIGRGMINIDMFNLYEAELILVDALRLIERHHLYKFLLRVKILLAKIYLLRFTNNRSQRDPLQISLQFLQEVIDLAQAQKLHLDYLEASILKAIMLSFLEKYKASEIILDELQVLADTKGLLIQSHRIGQISLIISHRIKYITNLISRDNILSNLFNEEILRITLNYYGYTITEKDIRSIFMITYRMDEVLGAEIQATTEIDPIYVESREKLNLVGSLYTASLGQGQNYNEGLYGPFPFGENDFKALVYSKNIFDASQQHLRNKGMSFTITCLIYPNQISPVFFDQKLLETIFQSHFAQISEMAMIDGKFLTKINNDILQEFVLQKLPETSENLSS